MFSVLDIFITCYEINKMCSFKIKLFIAIIHFLHFNIFIMASQIMQTSKAKTNGLAYIQEQSFWLGRGWKKIMGGCGLRFLPVHRKAGWSIFSGISCSVA